jgi:hypothetical protein
VSRPYNQDDNTGGEQASLSRHLRSAQVSTRHKARELVNTCLLKDLDDPDDYRLDAVGWDEWEDFIAFAESVLQDCESLTWGRPT